MIHALLLAAVASGDLYTETAVLAPPASLAGFSTAVAIEGSWLAVGHPTSGPNQEGSVEMYRLEQGSWTHDSSITRPGTLANDRFGIQVALGPDGFLYVTAERHDVFTPGDDIGSVFIFEHSASGWSEVGSLEPNSIDPPLMFGRDLTAGEGFVCTSSLLSQGGANHVVVATPPYFSGMVPPPMYTVPTSLFGSGGLPVASNEDGDIAIGIPTSDSVVILERTPPSWVPSVQMTGPEVGRSVAWLGPYVLSGAPERNQYSGEIAVFEPPISTEVGSIVNTPAGGMWLGVELVSTGDAVISTTYSYGGTHQVLRFEQVEGLGWNLRGTYNPVGPSFGLSLACDSEHVVIGAPTSNLAAVFENEDKYESYCFSTGNSTGGPGRLDAYGSRSLETQEFRLIASGVPDGPALAFSGQGQSILPFLNGFLCTGPGYMRHGVRHASGGLVEFRPWRMGPGRFSFQVWYPDPLSGGAGSNLTNGVSVEIMP